MVYFKGSCFFLKIRVKLGYFLLRQKFQLKKIFLAGTSSLYVWPELTIKKRFLNEFRMFFVANCLCMHNIINALPCLLVLYCFKLFVVDLGGFRGISIAIADNYEHVRSYSPWEV